MKHLRTYQELNESLTSVLYHFTWLTALVEMLKDDTINLTMAVGTTSDLKVNKEKFYFLSMQTTRNGGYGKRRELPVMLTMDGGKLNQRYKGGAVDYWQTRGSHQVKHDMDEFEERLMADDNEISLSKNVTAIHVWLKEMRGTSKEEVMKQASYAKKRADELGIPIFFYEEESAYFNHQKSKRVTVDTDLGDPEVNDWNKRSGGAFDILSVIVGPDPDEHQDWAGRIVFNKFIEKYKGMARDKQMEYIVKGFEDFSYKWQLENPSAYKIEDMYRSISADIHNGRSSSNKFLKWVLLQLTKDMKRTGAKTFKEYVEKKYIKF